jgi:predicted RNase H-like nuclease (RuvC/YqgF family)
MDGRQRDMMNLKETLEIYDNQVETAVMSKNDYVESVVAEFEESIARLDELLLESQDTIIELRRELARLNERTGG